MLTVLPHGVYSGLTYGSSTNTKGTITPGTSSSFTVMGTISATSPEDIARLEEGKRTRKAFKLFTESQLKTAVAGGQVPDRIQVGSEWYEISALVNWTNQVISHFEYVIVKIENP